jgi:hypothetical protein
MRRRESARRFFAGQAATRVPARRVGRCRGFLAARLNAPSPICEASAAPGLYLEALGARAPVAHRVQEEGADRDRSHARK